MSKAPKDSKNSVNSGTFNTSSKEKLAGCVEIGPHDYEPFQHRDFINGLGTMGALFHMIKGSLGSGILSMPMAFKDAGLWVGLIGAILIGILCTHCVHILIVLAVFSAVIQTVLCAQVFVKFLTPPHGYTHNLRLDPRGVAVAKEERIYQREPPEIFQSHGFQPQAAQTYSRRPQNYYYPRPAKPFEEYGVPPEYRNQYQGEQVFPPPPHPGFPPGRFSGGVGPGPRPGVPPPEPYLPNGEYMNPEVESLSQHQAELTYDPLLITGPQAAQYVDYLFSRGELFFHLIPHERLVLMNQQERVENNLLPHLLASIRPGHPFFFHR